MYQSVSVQSVWLIMPGWSHGKGNDTTTFKYLGDQNIVIEYYIKTKTHNINLEILTVSEPKTGKSETETVMELHY